MIAAARKISIIWLSALIFLGSGHALRGQSQPSDPIAYRRIFAPVDTVTTQIRGLLPMRRDEFERHVLAAGAVPSSNAESKPRVEAATYRARLRGTLLEDGEAELVVIASGDQTSWLSLVPCSLLLESASWDSPGRTVVWGAGPDGIVRCQVEGSGKLQFRWHQNPAMTTESAAHFDLRLPDALTRRLEIITDDGIELLVDGGSIISSAVRDNGSGSLLWTIDLTGAPEIRLHARPAQPNQRRMARAIVREETKYNVLPAVIDLQTRLTLDVLDEPLVELWLQASAGLRITAVRVAEQNLPFTMQAGPDGKDSRIGLQLSSPLQGTDRTIEVEATSTWSADKIVRLPRVIALDGDFQEGTFEVEAPPWMRLQTRSIAGCVQTDAAAVTSGRTADRFFYQAYAEDAAIEIIPNPKLLPLREESGTQITVEPNQVTGVLIAELSAAGGGARFALNADVPRQWILDSVETQPADRLADRTLLSHAQGPHRLQLKLTHPLTAQQPLRLILRGHFRRPPNDQVLDEAFFRLATFAEVHDFRQLVSLRVNDPLAELRLSGNDGLHRLDAGELTPAELRLFEGPPEALLLERASSAQTLKGTLKPTTARYQADATIRAELRHGKVEEKVTIRCQPDSSAVTSVVVRLAPRPAGELTWTLAGESTPLAALIEDSTTNDSQASDAVYRLLLPRPSNATFELIGQWTEPYAPGNLLPLVYLPAAIRQTGLVEVHAPDGDVFVRADEMHAVPAPLNDSTAGTLCGRYSYEASRRNKLVLDAMPSGVLDRRAWVEALELISQVRPGGGQRHELTLAIQNRGDHSLRLRFPAAVNASIVDEDGQQQLLDVAAADNTATINLPIHRTTATVRVSYESPFPPSGGVWPVKTIRAPVPRLDIPVLTRRWRVLLSPGMAAVHPNEEVIENASTREGLNKNNAETRGDLLGLSLRMAAGPALPARFLARDQASAAIDLAFAGWSELDRDLSPDGQAIIVVYYKPTIAAWGVCLALGIAGIGRWLPRGLGWRVGVAGLLATLGALASAPMTWLVGAVAAGLLISVLLELLNRGESPRPTVASPSVVAGLRYAIGPAASGVGLLMATISFGWAAGEAEENPSHRPRVVFPINDDQQPAGDYVYLEESLYDRIHGELSDDQVGMPSWLIEKTQFELPQAPVFSTAGAVIGQLDVTLDFHTMRPEATVRLPLRRDQVTLVNGRTRLDGTPAHVDWSADGAGLSLSVPAAGRHHLVLSLGAALRDMSEGFGLDIDVPLAAISAVRLPASSGDASVVSDGANGRLIVRWKSPERTGEATVPVVADQLLLWKIRPGSASLEGRFRLDTRSGARRAVILEVDSRLRLLPGRTVGPVASIQSAEGKRHCLKVELNEESASAPEFRLAWLWPDASGAGTLKLPAVRLVGYQLRHESTLLSLDPALDAGPAPGVATREETRIASPAPNLADVEQVWPGLNFSGCVLLSPERNGDARVVLIRPRESSPIVNEETEWSVSTSLAQATYTARVSGLSPTQFEHRVILPRQVQVSRVTVKQGERSTALRWLQQRDGRLIISLLEAPLPEQTLTVVADLRLQGQRGEFELDDFSLEGGREAVGAVRVYRRSDVQLQTKATAGWSTDNEAELGAYRSGLGRLELALKRQSTNRSPLRIARTVNSPRVSGKTFTRVDEADGDWSGEVQMHLNISGGLLDELRLSIPESWTGPLHIEPEMDQHLEASPTAARRQLVLRGRQATSGPSQITIRGPLHGGAYGLEAPDVMLVCDHSVERYVFLKRLLSGQRIDWDVTGLLPISAAQAADFPASWRNEADGIFRVVGQRFDALAKATAISAATPRALLADIRAVLHPEYKVAFEAALAIQPRGASSSVFTLPLGARLIAALVDGTPVACVQEGIRTWKISTPSDTLPYRLTIIYDTTLLRERASETSIRLLAPSLAGTEVKKTLWTIEDKRDPSSLEPDHLALNAEHLELCTLTRALISRLALAVQSLETVATAQSASISTNVVKDACFRWKRELASIQSQVLTIQSQAGLSASETADMQTALDAAAKVQQRLIQAGIINDSETGSTIGNAESPDSTAAIYFVSDGDAPELVLAERLAATKRLVASYRQAIAVCIALFSLLLAFMIHAVQNQAMALRAALVLFMVGLGWWLAAPLGWLGGLAMIGAMVSAVRWRLTRPHGESNSAILSAARGAPLLVR